MLELDSSLADKRARLLELIAGLGRVIVAYSGGIDSTVVAQAAQLALGERALAVTGVSASLAAGELDEARQIAARIGIRHEALPTDEFANPSYVQNAPDRCYHCKTELYSQLERLAERYPDAVILNGANLDDGGDYRPGLQAAAEHRVRSPLAECGFTKADVRALAVSWDLPTWDKPASPCLSSRVAYGEAVSPERLAMIDAAEQHLRSLGLRTVRVRYHAGDLARIEAPVEALAKLCEPVVREALLARLQELGFRYATLDLAGFRSGSLNDVLPLEALRQFAAPGRKR
ncbi:MAG: ATP-dependent sacrificial sulfur transferase LarE [Pirellulales bacterium]